MAESASAASLVMADFSAAGSARQAGQRNRII
jgi:hypothetical protein